MTTRSGVFQANFSAAVLRGAALAIALLASASPACAEVVTLVCQPASGDSFTLRVDYDRKIVDLLASDGTSIVSAAATISESDVNWNAVPKNTGGHQNTAGYHFIGSLNRLSGQGYAHYPEAILRGTEIVLASVSGTCRRATQKF